MSKQDETNKHKTKRLIIMLIAIIVVLFAGVVYQFITIKQLQKQSQNNAAIVSVLDSYEIPQNNF